MGASCSKLLRHAAFVAPSSGEYREVQGGVISRIGVKETLMRPSTKDKAEGKLREVRGALKEAIGAAARDRDLEVEGRFEKSLGKVQGAVGRVEKAVGK